MTVTFEASWCATDLGDYRPGRHTYQLYPYETLPVLDGSRFTGEFQWLGDPGETIADHVAEVAELEALLGAQGLALPKDFARFHLSSKLYGSLDEVSVTCCWSSLSKPLPSPVEPGAALVRFFRDQQDCVFWYLYLRPNGGAFVVSSFRDYEDEDDEPRSDLDDIEAHTATIFWAAPSFEQFAYRYWLENRLWQVVHHDGSDLEDAEMQAYLDHYKAA
jgi:hypothetical protein